MSWLTDAPPQGALQRLATSVHNFVTSKLMQSLVELSELTTTPAVSETLSVFRQFDVNCLKSKTLPIESALLWWILSTKKLRNFSRNLIFMRSQMWRFSEVSDGKKKNRFDESMKKTLGSKQFLDYHIVIFTEKLVEREKLWKVTSFGVKINLESRVPSDTTFI